MCSGNICRSPIGEKVLQAAFDAAGLGDRVTVSSAGTGDWHVGEPANSRAVRVLAAAGYPIEHAARQITAADIVDLDLLLAADHGHLRELRRLTTQHQKIALLRSFDPAADSDEVPDPYYGPDEDFEQVLAMIRAAAPGVVAAVGERLDR